METTILTKKKRTARKTIDIVVGNQVLKGARPPLSDEEFFELCLNNPDAHIEQDQHGNINVMSPVSYNSGNFEAEILGDLIIWNRQSKPDKTFSPSTLFILSDGQKRMADAWMANGVRLAWLIDPVEKKAWSYKPGREPLFFENSGITLSGEDVLPGFALKLPEGD